jgi:hypothetical protein
MINTAESTNASTNIDLFSELEPVETPGIPGNPNHFISDLMLSVISVIVVITGFAEYL